MATTTEAETVPLALMRTRVEAAARGAREFDCGRPCLHCESTARYVANLKCPTCERARRASYRDVAAKAAQKATRRRSKR